MPELASHSVFFLTGESSGDAYAAAIADRLRTSQPDLRCGGIGGPAMAQARLTLEERMDDRAIIGVFPALRRLPEFLTLLRRVETAIRINRPRLVVSIDYPDFNLHLQRRIADLTSTRRIHIVAPQVWAWRRRRAKAIARSVDDLCCFFPFEPPLFDRFGCRTHFVGHPMVDLVRADPSTPQDRQQRMLLLAPGGRQKEVLSLLPDFDQAARLVCTLLARSGQTPPRVVIAGAEGVPDAAYRHSSRFPIVRGGYRDLCRQAHVAAIASGTATLEAALVGLPHVIAYRLDPVSARILRHLIRVPWVGLPNIIHGRSVVTELLQDACNPSRLAAELLRLWQAETHASVAQQLSATADLLGGGGALDRTSDLLIDLLHRPAAGPLDESHLVSV